VGAQSALTILYGVGMEGTQTERLSPLSVNNSPVRLGLIVSIVYIRTYSKLVNTLECHVRTTYFETVSCAVE